MTRTNRHSSHPDHDAGEVECGEEVNGAAVIACGDVPEVFELVEEALDAVAQPVGEAVMRDLNLAGGGRGNDGLRPAPSISSRKALLS